MENKIKLDIKGIKCDNPKCDFKDMTVKVKDYDKWLNRKCPKCGAILLTEADYNNVKMLIALENATNDVFEGIDFGTGEDSTVDVKMNGSGSMEFVNRK